MTCARDKTDLEEVVQFTCDFDTGGATTYDDLEQGEVG